MIFESWRDRLRWIIEHNGEYFHKWQICNSASSWTSKNRGMFSLLFGHPVLGSFRSLSWSYTALSEDRKRS
jgi:hypothetical protein